MINIIIPAYNCQATLGRTLASLVAQTDNQFEVIVVDDHSTEDIKSIVNDYNSKLQIIYIRNEKNLGCGMSRQVGIDNATQKFITFLDSDDLFMPYTVEIFNSTIAANPNLEYLHTYFYEQGIMDGNPALLLHKDGFTHCHGKLYNLDLIKKFNIRNSPEIRWADDSFFNSMCTELMKVEVIQMPTVIWCNNQNSVMRSKNPERDAKVTEDFLHAMHLSAQFVLQHKNNVSHLKATVDHNLHKNTLNEKEAQQLLKLQGGN